MTTWNAWILLAVAVLVGCQAAEEPAAPEPESLVADGAGVLVAALPTGFSVASNDSQGLRLAVAPEAGGGELAVSMSPVFPGGLNIIEAVETEMANFESRPGG